MDRTRPLGDSDEHLYVTYAAAKTYADATGLEPEPARRTLTELLLDANPRGITESGAERWRYRKGDRIDMEAHVIRENGLAVVIHLHVRRVRLEKGTPHGG